MKTIKLTQGKYALVDNEDYRILNQYKWCVQGEYAGRCIWKNKKCIAVRMHRIVMNNPEGYYIDHIDGNGLNNQKSNLRLATPAQNTRNSIMKHQGNKGVLEIKNKRKPSRFRTTVKGINIAEFKNEHHAALAYDLWAKDLFGEFARTNFNVVAFG